MKTVKNSDPFLPTFEDLGEGIPLLLTHGLGASRQQILSSFVGIGGVRLIAPDMPDHALSLQPFNSIEPSFQEFAEVVVRLLDYLQLESAVLGGISMGCGVSLAVALKFPERVKGLILCRPAWLDRCAPANLEIIRLMGEWIQDKGAEFANSALEHNAQYRALCKENPACAASIKGAIRPQSSTRYGATLQKMVEDRPVRDMEDLTDICVPALVLANHHDPLHPVEHARICANRLPLSEFKMLPPKYLESGPHQFALTAAVEKFIEKNAFTL